METDAIQSQLDALQAEVRQLAASLEEVRAMVQQQSTPPLGKHGHTDERTDGWPPLANERAAEESLKGSEGDKGFRGFITSSGEYSTEERSYRWGFDDVSVESLLQLDEEKVARVLMAIGNKQRLGLLKAILQEPASAAELVTRLGMGTTGQVYHHLKALQAGDLIRQENRGQFVCTAHRVPGLVMLLAAVQALLDTRYSAGNWEEEGE